MEVVITSDADGAARVVVDAIDRLVTTVERPVLGLATGSSPLPVYRELIARHREGELSFASCRAFLLDEYVGLGAGHPESYRTFIEQELTSHIDIDSGAVFGPDGDAADPIEAALAYDRMIADAGRVDLQILGIGRDGHIGFNEPTSSLASRTRLKTLTEATRQDNARFFGGDVNAVPRHVLTQGIGTILDARHLVLVAAGGWKAAAVAAAIEGPLTAMVPASALQLHPHASVVIDEAAAGELTNIDYYRETYAAKPAWQDL